MAKTSNKEPAALFKLLMYTWCRKLAKFVGIDLFLDNYKPTAYTYMLVSWLLLFGGTCIYTIYYYEFDEKVVCVSVFAFSGQGLVKYYGFVKNAKSIKTFVDFSLKVYTSNTNPNPNPHKTCLKKSVKLTVIVFKSGMTLLIVTAMSEAVMPIISYFFNGQLQPILPVYFPGLNEHEVVGYVILATFHFSILLLFVFGTAIVDLSLMTFVVHSYVMSQIFQNAVNHLNSKIKIKTIKRNAMEIRATLDNLILMHNDFVKYMHQLKVNFYEICLIQIMMANLAMCVLVYVIFMMSWFPAYFLIATAFFQVFEYSLLGTIVEIVNDRVYDSICDIQLTNLHKTEQKGVILMMVMAQQPHNLTLGGIRELNVTTFVSAMKTTYSVAMLLLSTKK